MIIWVEIMRAKSLSDKSLAIYQKSGHLYRTFISGKGPLHYFS